LLRYRHRRPEQAKNRGRQQPSATAEGGILVALAAAGWEVRMLETIAIILIVLWLLGMVSGYTMGNFIYVLLVVAIVLFLVRLVSGRRVV
jgi:hypothetical protein